MTEVGPQQVHPARNVSYHSTSRTFLESAICVSMHPVAVNYKAVRTSWYTLVRGDGSICGKKTCGVRLTKPHVSSTSASCFYVLK